ncbi:hypothetical protein [Azospirillum endophyticum]
MSRDPMDAVPEDQDLVFVAEWLAQQFLSPPDLQQVEAARSMAGQIALRRIGHRLGQPAAADALCQLLAAGSAADVTLAIERRHTALFEGIFRQRSVPPYPACGMAPAASAARPSTACVRSCVTSTCMSRRIAPSRPIIWRSSWRRWRRRCGSGGPRLWPT